MSEQRRVIFLDVDGVLRGSSCDIESASFVKEDPDLFWVDKAVTATLPPFSRACLQRLKDLVAASSAKIVVCSSWRTNATLLSSLIRCLAQFGLPEGSVVGETPILGGSRGAEVAAWLRGAAAAAATPLCSYVVLDDDNKSSYEKEGIAPKRYVQPTAALGLSDADAEKALGILLHQERRWVAPKPPGQFDSVV